MWKLRYASIVVRLLASVLAAGLLAAPAAALGTAFTYQGQLTQGGGLRRRGSDGFESGGVTAWSSAVGLP